MVEYEPSWLEQRLEERLLKEIGVVLPPAKGLDTRGFPKRVDLCRYIIGSYCPFEGVVYTKAFNPHMMVPQQALAEQEIAATLGRSLGRADCLEEEMVRFLLRDGMVTLIHAHRCRRRCRDEGFKVRWGGGDLSACPVAATDEGTRYEADGSALGRKECLYALDAVIRGGGLNLEY